MPKARRIISHAVQHAGEMEAPGPVPVVALMERRKAEQEAKAERESSDVIGKMRARGFQLVTRLDTGEGVFVREERVTALHVQLPADLYQRLDAECRRREVSKKTIVVEALERLLEVPTG